MPKLKKDDFIKSGAYKPASGGDFSGQNRVEICYKKIEKQLPFIIGENERGSKVYGVSLTAEGKGKPGLNNYPYYLTFTRQKNAKIRDQEQLKITEFFKDEDFGGGGSRAKQSDNTGPTESGCAYYCSLVFNVVKRELKLEDCTKANLKEAANFVQATSSLNDFLTKGPQDWVDEGVYINTANEVFNKFKSKIKTPVYCHRGSSFMTNLYKAFKSAKDKDAKEEKIAPGSFNNDKWNPGDIWLSSYDPKSEPLKECRNFSDLKKCVLRYAGADSKGQKETELLAVSLKKPGNSKKAKLKEFNTETRTNFKDGEVVYNGFSFGKTGNFFSSNDIYLYIGGKDVQFRAFNTTSGWQGNIIGTGALGGKIGGGNIDFYMVNAGIKSISANPSGSFKETLTGQLKKTDYKLLYDLYVKYWAKQSKVQYKSFPLISSFDTFEKERKLKSNHFTWQKLMGMRMIDALESSTKKKRNDVGTEIIRYAASNTDISTYFIKIE